MAVVCFVVLFLLLIQVGVQALDNGLGARPGMGWNSDYCTNCTSEELGGFQNEDFVWFIAQYINQSGLQSLGYRYVNMDAGWDTYNRSATGDLVPDPTEWPSGLPFSVQRVHSLGLGFGLYGDRGTMDCNQRPGNLGYEKQDAEFYANMEIDWYKSDSCYATSVPEQAFEEYGTMRDALNATGRHIWFALCGWYPWYAPVGKTLGNSWRVGPDTGQGWTPVLQNVQNSLSMSQYGGPSVSGGGWNDMCLLLTPGMGSGPDEMSFDRHRTQFSMWCVLSANLLMTGNLSALDPAVLATWSNSEVIAVDQDPRGYPTIRLDSDARSIMRENFPPHASKHRPSSYEYTYIQAYVQECGGEPAYQEWNLNMPMLGFFHNNITSLCLNVDDCQTEVIYDSCTTSGDTCAGHNVFSNQMWTVTAAHQIQTQLPDHYCLTVDSQNLLTIEPCHDPVPDNQTFFYNTVSLQITTTNQMCVTAPSSSPNNVTFVLGKQLEDGSWAAVFVNNDVQTRDIECDLNCFAAMGFPESQELVVRDLWLHENVTSIYADAPYSISVDAMGASAMVRFIPI